MERPTAAPDIKPVTVQQNRAGGFMARRNLQSIDPKVRRALEQLSVKARRRVTAFARRRTKMIARAGEPVASDEPSILVQDAITDTLIGAAPVTADLDARPGQPEHEQPDAKIEGHLRKLIGRRTWSRLARARKRLRVPIEVFGDSAIDGDIERLRADASLGRARVARRLGGELRARATRDPQLLTLLDAYEAGADTPREVMDLTGWSRPDFQNVRRRLDRTLAAVPEELRRAALETMREQTGS